jgi:hypothetical protein
VKVVALIVPAFIASLKVALSTWPMGTLIAPFAGIVDTTAGAGVIVVKDHVKGPIRPAPPGAEAPVVIVAV